MRRVRGGDVAMVFQEPMTSLNPVLSIGAQLTEAIERAYQGSENAEARARSADCRAAFRKPRAGSSNFRTNCPAACASA
jgi:ABC-type microcin C transport system duplicated ATPase subunit YejF